MKALLLFSISKCLEAQRMPRGHRGSEEYTFSINITKEKPASEHFPSFFLPPLFLCMLFLNKDQFHAKINLLLEFSLQQILINSKSLFWD